MDIQSKEALIRSLEKTIEEKDVKDVFEHDIQKELLEEKQWKPSGPLGTYSATVEINSLKRKIEDLEQHLLEKNSRIADLERGMPTTHLYSNVVFVLGIYGTNVQNNQSSSISIKSREICNRMIDEFCRELPEWRDAQKSLIVDIRCDFERTLTNIEKVVHQLLQQRQPQMGSVYLYLLL